MFKWFSLLFVLVSLTIDAGLMPDYDKRCDLMLCHAADVDPSIHPEQAGYFSKEVPKIVHQIWFGNRSRLDKAKTALWEKYAQKFKYKYKLWTEDDDAEIKSFMSSKNYELMLFLRKNRDYWAASDVLRYELIKKFGGVYADCDFSPPTSSNGLVDLQQIIDFRGLSVMTEFKARNVGTTGIFAANGFIICSPDHPVICSLVDQVYDNAMHWYEKQKKIDPMIMTGTFFLNKVLSGCYDVVPCIYLKKYNMFD